MPEFSWQAVSPLHRALLSHRDGGATSTPEVRLRELTGFSLALVMARRGRWTETATAALRYYGVAPPARPAAVTATTATLVWSGPCQFMALAPQDTGGPPLAAIRAAFAGKASVSEQSGGRCLVQLAGPRIRECLARLCSVDLDERVFAVGAAAAFSIDHSTVNMWRAADGPDRHPVFNILISASFAESIWQAIGEATSGYSAISNERGSLTFQVAGDEHSLESLGGRSIRGKD